MMSSTDGFQIKFERNRTVIYFKFLIEDPLSKNFLTMPQFPQDYKIIDTYHLKVDLR